MQQLQWPSLLVIPRLSVATPSFVPHSLKSLPASVKLVEIDHASHDIYLDQPEAVARAVREYLGL